MAQEKKDQWSSKVYANAASFVPALTTTVVKYLDPQAHERILDVGCGDGVLTANIVPRCKELVGLDSSPSMIQTATETVKGKYPHTHFYTKDCRTLSPTDSDANAELQKVLQPGSYDKVFSNAAMHWILGHANPRKAFFADVAALLKPGGAFVFEMGGAGNVAEVHAALMSVLNARYNVPFDKIRAANPWFFPSENWMRETLTEVGLDVEKVELEYRPTRLTENTQSGGGGMEGWTRLMGAPFLDLVEDQSERDNAVRHIVEVLKPVVGRVEDDSEWLGYVRLRAIARKPQ